MHSLSRRDCPSSSVLNRIRPQVLAHEVSIERIRRTEAARNGRAGTMDGDSTMEQQEHQQQVQEERLEVRRAPQLVAAETQDMHAAALHCL